MVRICFPLVLWILLSSINCELPECSFTDLSFGILLDNSASVSNANMQDLKNFVKRLVTRVGISANSRLTLSQFATTRNIEINCNDHSTVASFNVDVDSIRRLNGGICTSCGLIQSLNSLRMNGCTTSKNRVLLVVVHGDENINPTATRPMAANLRLEGITIRALGVGSSVSDSELSKIAGSDENDRRVDTYSDLQNLDIDDIYSWLTSSYCTTGGFVDVNWGEWGNWGSCSRDCDSTALGVTPERIRSRQCPAVGTTCTPGAVEAETGSCSIGVPCQDVISQWSNWGACSSSCVFTSNTATRSRTRTCTGVCTGVAITDTEFCNNGLICDFLSQWSNWRACVASCQANAVPPTRLRTRTCSNSMNNCGEAALIEVNACNVGVDCGGAIRCSSANVSYVIVMDSSSSVSEGNVRVPNSDAWTQEKNFVKHFAEEIGLGTNPNVRVGLVNYGTSAQAVAGCNSESTRTLANFNALVDSLPRIQGGTAIHAALLTARDVYTGAGCDRENEVRIIFFLTDGHENILSDDQEAQRIEALIRAEALVYIGAVGGQYKYDELERITQDENLIREVTTFADLENVDTAFIVPQLLNRVCERFVDVNWGEWGNWGSCSRDCDSTALGIAPERTRSRQCPAVGTTCTPGAVEAEIGSCNIVVPCQGTLPNWGFWSGCSATCQSGSSKPFRTRSRVCSDITLTGNCNNAAASETETCNTHTCEVPQRNLSLRHDFQVFISVKGTDTDNCGNFSIPCHTLRYAYQHRVESNGTLLIMNENCDTHTIKETIFLSATINVRGIRKNGCVPTLTSKKKIPSFGLEKSSKQIKISIDSIRLLDVNLIHNGRNPEAVTITITNCSIISMANQMFLTVTTTNHTKIFIHSSTFISSGISIVGYDSNIYRNVFAKITDSTFANDSTVMMINADTFIVSGCEFNSQLKYYILLPQNVKYLEIKDILVHDCKRFIYVRDSIIAIHGLTIKNIYGNSDLIYLHGSNTSMSNLTIKSGRCKCVLVVQYNDLVSISNITIQDMLTSVCMIALNVNSDVRLKEIKIVNGSAKDGITIHRGKSLSLSNILIKETKVKTFLLQVWGQFSASGVNINGIEIVKGLVDGDAIYLLMQKSLSLSNISMKETRVKKRFLGVVGTIGTTASNINGIEIVKGSANGDGIEIDGRTSLLLSNISIKETLVKESFLLIKSADDININMINFLSSSAGTDGVRVEESKSVILSNVIFQNTSLTNVMLHAIFVLNFSSTYIHVSNSKASKLISNLEDTEDISTTSYNNRNRSFDSRLITTRKREYSRSFTLDNWRNLGSLSLMKLSLSVESLEYEMKRRFVPQSLEIHLSNVVSKNSALEIAIKSAKVLLWINNFYMDHSKSGIVFDIEGGTVTLLNINITCNECARFINSNFSIENSLFKVSKSGVYYRNDNNFGVAMDVKNVLIVTTAKIATPIIELDTKIPFQSSLINFINSSLSCSNNSYPYHEIKRTDVFLFMYFCKPCRKGTFTFDDEITMFSFNTFVNISTFPEHPNKLGEPSYRITRRSINLVFQNLKSISCKNCPSGGTCDGNIVSNDNYWGNLDRSTGNVNFVPCPDGYCCSDKTKPCNSYYTCNQHRHGKLCSSCMQRYSVDYFSTNCISTLSCENPIYFWLLFILSLFLYILGIAYLDKLKNITSFLKTVINFFTCRKLFRSNKHNNEEEAYTSLELRLYNDIKKDGDNAAADIHLFLPNEITPRKESDEDCCRWSGLFNVLVSFYQLKQLMTIDLGSQYSTSKIDMFFIDLFNLEIIKPSFTLCPSLQLNDFQKLVIKDFVLSAGLVIPVTVAALLLHILTLYGISWGKSKSLEERSSGTSADEDLPSEDIPTSIQPKDIYSTDSNPNEISFLCRSYICFLRLLNIKYKNIATFSLVMIHCIAVDNINVLYVYAEKVCWGLIQYFAAAFLCWWIIPFPVSLYLSLRLLRANLITVERFLVFTTMPVIVPFYYISISFKNVCYRVSEEKNKLKSSIEEIFEQPYRSDGHKTYAHWHSWLLIQRLIIAYLIVFYIDPISRLTTIFPIMAVFLFIQLNVKPYKDALVNNLEAVSTFILIIFAGINMLRSVLYVHRIENAESISKVLVTYDTIDPLLNPISFFILYFIYENLGKIWKAVNLHLIKIIRKKLV